jgi:hypothetical protein
MGAVSFQRSAIGFQQSAFGGERSASVLKAGLFGEYRRWFAIGQVRF